MTNNDVLRRLRFILDYNDETMMKTFKNVKMDVSREVLSNWLKKDDDPDYKAIKDVELASFLDGLIIDKRGKKEGQDPFPESVLTNNIIFRKIKIALNLTTDDILNILDLVDLRVSKAELGAFFRKPTHKNYRECKDQILRNFLSGLQKVPSELADDQN